MSCVRGRRQVPLALLVLCICAELSPAQDARSVRSPDGDLEFRLFTALPQGSILNCLAYQIWLRGKPVLDTSYLGLDVLFQEPLLGENVGLSADRPIRDAHYNGLWADYLQTSTTGRRIQFEVRVWNDGVAFRYIVPRSALLFDLAIADDTTQFRLAAPVSEELPPSTTIPYIEKLFDGEWLGIYSQALPGFPAMQLKRLDTRTLLSHMPGGVPEQVPAFQTKTPWTGPWHMIVFGKDRDQLAQSEILRELSR